VDSVDDLGVVDALEIDAGDAEVAVAELALDHDQRHALASELDGVRVPRLVRRDAPPAAACGAAEDAEERPHGKRDTRLKPRLQLRPSPRVHARLAAPCTLAAADQQCAAARVEIGLGERERFVDAQPGTQRITIKPRSRRPCPPSPAARMTAMVSSTLGGSAG
jgi:hypothetical protein